MSSNSDLDKLLQICSEYVKSEEYVYKLCADCLDTDPSKKQWFVILQILDDTNTNDWRNDIADKKCAKFRADKLKVIRIIINGINQVYNT
jgi:hypothetical protein